MTPPSLPVSAGGNFSPVAVIGVGRAGAAVVAQLRAAGVPAEASFAVFSRHLGDTTPAEAGVLALPSHALDAFANQPTPNLAALHPGLAEAVRRACAGRQWVFIVSGLGGRTGSTLAPLLAAELRQVCNRVLAFVTLPGTEEGAERSLRARRALAGLATASAGVFCLGHDQVAGADDALAPLTAMFEVPGKLLAASAHGLWRMLTAHPIIRLHADELCQHLNGVACRTFASLEASGEGRATVVVQKLLAHPLLAEGAALRQSKVVLGLTGGSDLSRADIRQVVQQIERAAEGVHLVMSVGTLPELTGRLVLTVFARPDATTAMVEEVVPALPAAETRFVPGNEIPGTLPLNARTQSQTAEPARLDLGASQGRRRPTRGPQQGQLALDMLQRGRFEKGEPTIHNGENLDLPTYIRRGINLN